MEATQVIAESIQTIFFYGPVILYYLVLAALHRDISFITAANPGIYTGGLIGESKIEILRSLYTTSPEFTSRSALISCGPEELRIKQLHRHCEALSIQPPFIIKPDKGQNGIGVRLMVSMEDAEAYVRGTPFSLIIQEYERGPHEVGIFYYRFPTQSKGRILSITEKIFPEIVGDGAHTLQELLSASAFTRERVKWYLNRLGMSKSYVLAEGEKIALATYGNYKQGCYFRDGQRLWSERLEGRIDEISRQFKGFYIGRYDIRYSSERELMAGRHFRIVELNGVGSEDTTIYDPNLDSFSKYARLFRVLELASRIAVANKQRGAKTTPARDIWENVRNHFREAGSYS